MDAKEVVDRFNRWDPGTITIGDAIIQLENELSDLNRRIACTKLALDTLRRAQQVRLNDQ